MIQSLQQGNYVDAGLGTASAVGGAAIIGTLIYNHAQEADKHETDGARAFLQGAGINAD